MKVINYTEEFAGATGQPFYIPDPDVAAQRKAREDAVKAGRPTYEKPMIKGTFASIMIWFADNMPHNEEYDEKGRPTRKLTIEDSGNAYEVIKAFRAAEDGRVELEDAVYKWLLGAVDTDGIAAFRAASMAALIKERLQDLKEQRLPE